MTGTIDPAYTLTGELQDRCRGLEKENAELKEALGAWKNEALQSRASMELIMRGLDERDELKRQIKEGELIPLSVADSPCSAGLWHCSCGYSYHNGVGRCVKCGAYKPNSAIDKQAKRQEEGE